MEIEEELNLSIIFMKINALPQDSDSKHKSLDLFNTTMTSSELLSNFNVNKKYLFYAYLYFYWILGLNRVHSKKFQIFI